MAGVTQLSMSSLAFRTAGFLVRGACRCEGWRAAVVQGLNVLVMNRLQGR